MIEHRFTLTCTTTTPLRLSSGDGSALADTALRRSADGTLLVPGTSLAGVLRSLVERLSGSACLIDQGPGQRGAERCGCAACKLFGDVRVGAKGAKASRVTIHDAPLDDARPRVTDSVAIERSRRAAADARKFDQEELAPGATFRVEVIGRVLSQEESGWLGGALRLLGEGAIPIGGRGAQGYGRLEASKMICRQRNTLDPAHVLAAVLHDPDDEAAWPDTVDPFPGADITLPGRAVVEFEVAVAEDATFLVADPAAAVATGFDRAPRGGPGSPELPGPSLRGVLRAQAERILRTLAPAAACDPTNPETCCAAQERRSKRKRPTFERCLACRLFGNEEWASWLRLRVDRVADGTPVPFDHVAIDRFTGGARDSLKFDALASRSARWAVSIDLTAVPEQDRPWARGLLALVLVDLRDGRVAVGHGAARGHGRLVITQAPDFGEPLEPCVDALWTRLGVERPGEEVAS